MRICLISVEFFINKSGGFGRAARTIGRELAPRGVEVYALVPRQGDQGPREEHDSIIVIGFSKRRPWEAYWLCKEIDADVYHSCEPSMTTVFARWAMSPKKHIITFRDPRSWDDWSKEFERPARSKLQVISNWIFEGNHLVRQAVRRADGVYSIGRYLIPKIKQIYGVDSTFLPTPVEVPQAVTKASRPTVGWLARWDPIKRPEIFLQLPPKCQTACNIDPRSASNFDPREVVPVVHRRGRAGSERAPSALASGRRGRCLCTHRGNR
jgi:Glycosyltransferase Family 4